MMSIRQEDRLSAWESIRKLMNATKDNPVLTQEEVLTLGAYFVHGDKNMVTLPLKLIKQYDTWLEAMSQSDVDYDKGKDIYTRLHAKLEEYLSPKELEDHA